MLSSCFLTLQLLFFRAQCHNHFLLFPESLEHYTLRVKSSDTRREDNDGWCCPRDQLMRSREHIDLIFLNIFGRTSKRQIERRNISHQNCATIESFSTLSLNPSFRAEFQNLIAVELQENERNNGLTLTGSKIPLKGVMFKGPLTSMSS